LSNTPGTGAGTGSYERDTKTSAAKSAGGMKRRNGVGSGNPCGEKRRKGPKIGEGGEGKRRDSYRVGLRLDLEWDDTGP